MIRLAIILILLALPARAEPVHTAPECGLRTIASYNSGDDSERFTQVVGNYQLYSVFVLGHVPGYEIRVNPGDVLIVHGDGEITNDTGVLWEFVHKIDAWVPDIGWVEIAEENGVNISWKPRHHEQTTKSGEWVVPDMVPADTKIQIHWRWRGRGIPGGRMNWLTVGGCLGCLDYGRLIAEHKRPEEC